MTKAYDDLVEEVSHWDGLFVGQLDGTELETLDRAVASGIAKRSYEGAGGFMGLAKVRVTLPNPPERRSRDVTREGAEE